MSQNYKLLIVDDEKTQRNILTKILGKEGYLVKSAESAEEALKLIEREPFHIVLTDQKMPGMTGLELIDAIKSKIENIAIVLMTAHGTISTAASAMQKGAADYISKPFEKEELFIVLNKVKSRIVLISERDNLKRQLESKFHFGRIVGKSPEMLEIYDVIEKVLDKNIPVLIQGESGTGKELVAKSIHFSGFRKDRPFIALNCAAIPENLIESEFFGYEKGAFTGAKESTPGKFELANKGTLFLDEIGSMQYNLQAKLLRALQEKEILRVGGSKPVKVDVRIIAATSENLEEAIEKGTFRDDLYYRLNVVPINLPPLRKRKNDIAVLIENFIKEFNREYDKNISGITPDTLEIMIDYRWPGNVRELRNTIERMIVLCSGEKLTIQDIPASILDGYITEENEDNRPASSIALPENGINLEEIERDFIFQAMKKGKGNLSEASRLLGISYKTLQYRLKKFDFHKEDFK